MCVCVHDMQELSIAIDTTFSGNLNIHTMHLKFMASLKESWEMSWVKAVGNCSTVRGKLPFSGFFGEIAKTMG